MGIGGAGRRWSGVGRARRVRWVAGSLGVAGLALLGIVGGAASALPGASAAAVRAVTAGSTPAPGGPMLPPIPGPAARGPFYLALGASESLGVEPRLTGPLYDRRAGHRTRSRTTAHDGVPTDHGYADDVARAERHRWPGLRLVQLGCAGITVTAALYGGGTCDYPAGSEVATAVRFLEDHPGHTVLATVDLGYNDLWPCLVHHSVDAACVSRAMGAVRRDVPVILRRLRAAGGRRLLTIGLEHNDPFLADWLHGPDGRHFADTTLKIFNRFNQELDRLYMAGDARPADVPAEWRSGSTGRILLTGHGRVPADVALMCTDSWACRVGNVHPNAAGYREIAEAVAAAGRLPVTSSTARGATSPRSG